MASDYRTTPELVTGLMRGDVQVGFEYYAGLNAAVRGGQLKAVATTGSKRTPALPAVPSIFICSPSSGIGLLRDLSSVICEAP